MTAPTYSHDLTDVNLAETTTGWSAYGGGASGLAQNPDSSMQGVNGVGKQITAADKGQYFDNGSGITLGTGDHVFIWLFCTTPGLTDTIQNKGVSIYLGSTSANYCQYHVEGKDTYGAAGRVGKCYPIDYSVRSTNSSPPYRTASGSPGSAPALFGGGLKTTASVKGENCVVDAIRYGTGAYITAGDGTTPATFGGFSFLNDANDATNGYNRWGILTGVGGGYELQGAFVIGQNNAGTATACYFEDSDVNISLVDAIHASSTFNKFVIDHASTECYWTNVNITALGTTNRGQITVNSADPIFQVTGGTWTGLDTITLRSNSAFDGVTLRQTAAITLNSGTLDNCLIDRNRASAAVVLSNLNQITDCTFVSDGTGHAVNLGTISSDVAMTWANTDSGYASTDGSTGNETILVSVDSTKTLTINVSAGYSTPTVYNTGSGTVDVVTGQTTFSFALSPAITGYEWRLYEDSGVPGELGTTELAGEETASTSSQSPAYTYTYSSDTDAVLQIIATGYEEVNAYYTLGNTDQSVTITLTPETNT